MKLTAISSPKIYADDDLLSILDECLPNLEEDSIIAVTSKVVSLWEGAVIPQKSIDKHTLIKQEAESYLHPSPDAPHPFYLTIKHNLLIPSAGIDESNSGSNNENDGQYILYPKDPFASLENIWKHLRARHNLQNLGVIMTDSHTTPFRRGVTGIALAWCGFDPLKNYAGTPDCFGRTLRFTSRNNIDGLAAAAVFMMCEGSEQTPFCLIENLKDIVFSKNPPSNDERTHMLVPMKEDLYGPLLDYAPWVKG
jgi:putative folate metabolism gamma-glutamate ligase